MMKKMNLIALLAIIATANNISASFAKRASTAALLVGIKTQQAVTTTIKKHPKKAIFGAGLGALYLASPIIKPIVTDAAIDYALTPLIKNGLIIAEKRGSETLNPEELEKIRTSTQKGNSTNCSTCLSRLIKEELPAYKNANTEQEKIVPTITIGNKILKLLEKRKSLPTSCETCNPSKESNTK